jgi:hypothetical protein
MREIYLSEFPGYYKIVITVARLPKTRSGEIRCGTIRKIAGGESWTMPATVDDPAILGEIEGAPKRHGVGAWVSNRGVGATRCFVKNNPMLLHMMMKNIIYYCRYTRRYTHLIGIVWHGMAPKTGLHDRLGKARSASPCAHAAAYTTPGRAPASTAKLVFELRSVAPPTRQPHPRATM